MASNINSTRNYDIDGRTYHNTSNESRSRINSARRSDVDARNYSNAMHTTGGAKIFGFKGGALGTGVLTNVIMWLVIGAIAFLGFNFLWPLIKKWKANIDPEPEDVLNKRENEILKHSTDRMANGDTYMSAAEYLYNSLWGSNPLGWWRSTDHDVIGTYMQNVSKGEYVQLNNTYVSYKKGITNWYVIGSNICDLTGDLNDLFSSSEKIKYLSHLGVF